MNHTYTSTSYVAMTRFLKQHDTCIRCLGVQAPKRSCSCFPSNTRLDKLPHIHFASCAFLSDKTSVHAAWVLCSLHLLHEHLTLFFALVLLQILHGCPWVNHRPLFILVTQPNSGSDQVDAASEELMTMYSLRTRVDLPAAEDVGQVGGTQESELQ